MHYRPPLVRILPVGAILVLLLQTVPSVAAQQDQSGAKEPFRLTFEVDPYWNGPEKESLQQISNMHPFVLSWLLRDSENLSGIKPEDIRQVEMNGDPPNGGAFIIKTLRPIDTEKALAALVPDARERQHARRAYFANDEGAVCFLDAQTLITSPAKLMPARIDRYESTENRSKATSSAEKSIKPLVDLKFKPTAFREGLPPKGPPEWLRTLVNAELLTATFLPAEQLSVRFELQFSTADEAAASVPAVKESLAQLGQYLEMAEENMPMAIERFALEYPGAEKLGPMLDAAIKSARTGLGNAKIEQTGEVVNVKVSIESKQPATDAVLLLSLMPRAASE